MKTKYIITLLFALLNATMYAQWPVATGSAGTITGTIGEVRGGGTRIHNGTDIISGNNYSVCSIQSDSIVAINYKPATAHQAWIRTKSGAIYRHVNPLDYVAKNRNQANAINAGTRKIGLAPSQNFATMVQESGWPTHVHMDDNLATNYLKSNGFGAPGFVFLDQVQPSFTPINKNTIRLAKDMSTNQLWNNPTFLSQYITNEGFADNLQPLVVYGKVDVVAKVYQRGIKPNGTSTNSNHLAPYTLGYKLVDLTTGATVFEDLERLKFDFGNPENSIAVLKKIHTTSSTAADPIFIVSNKYINAIATDESLNSEAYPDGDYDLIVNAKGTPGTGAVAPENSLAKKIRIDNYKAYVKKVSVTDVSTPNNLVRYFAEWSALGLQGDGLIELLVKNSEPFKGNSPVQISVTTSEKLPFLNLILPNQDIPLTQSGSSGTEWTGNFTIPDNTPNQKLQLKFRSGDRLFGLQLNQNSADVKRNANGNFSDANQNPVDKFHELRTCPSDYLFNLDVTVVDGQNVTLTASGGTPPYTYSIDEMPIAPNHQSAFSSTNTFLIDYDKNYLFKVRDSGDCQAEEYYTLPRVPCDQVAYAGAQGTDRKIVNLGNAGGQVTVTWDMYSIPDQITVEYNNTSWTSGIVSNTGSHTFTHTPGTGVANSAIIIVYAPDPGTAWEYQVSCPSSTAKVSPNADLVKTSYKNNRVVVESPLGDNDNTIYTLYYRSPDEEEWSTINSVSLPYSYDGINKELKFKLVPENFMNSSSFIAYPNPTSDKIQLQYDAEEDGEFELMIFTIQGVMIRKLNVPTAKGKNSLVLGTENISDGIYLVRGNQSGKSVSTKVVISKLAKE